MIERDRNRPVWPETVVLWGAGATAALGFPTTIQQATCLSELAGRGSRLEERVQLAFPKAHRRDQSDIKDFLLILGDTDNNVKNGQNCDDAMHRQFGLLNRLDLRRQMNELRRTYDWPTLRRVILGSPRDNSEAISMQDLFNLLDLHIQSNSGFRVPGSNNKIESTFIRPEDFVPARRALQLLIILQFYIWFRRLLLEKSDLLKPYRHFAESLARLMEEEGFELANRGAELKNRSYYLFGYSVVSMNWDPLLLWLVFNAHKMANHHWPESKVGRPARPQKLFNDLAYMVAVRQVDGGDRVRSKVRAVQFSMPEWS